MSKSALLELAERVEKASEPDRELDVLILAEIENRDVRWDGNLLLGRHRLPPHDECRLGSIDPGKLARNFSVAWSSPECPPYTSSLDAAMTLVPEGCDWIIGNVNGHMGGTPYACVGSEKEHFGETPVLSLVLACLRARASHGDDRCR